MVKKTKKDDKQVPDDVFETIIVESRQAATVVLMLSSPEEEVQSKACEALYKFVEKCDANKKILLELEGLDPLLSLISSVDKTVRRHAIMAVGVMCSHPDVRKFMRKKLMSIPSIVALLGPEEDSIVHEFAALALSLLATEFTSKVAIFEAGGMEPLIKLLSSNDPDVQKNSIETIAQIVMDYKARAVVREFDGLNAVLDLVRSEYAIIQRLALLALERLTQDAENRRVLREIDGMSRLLEVMAQPMLNDLHVMVVMVLSNLLEDKDSLELIRDTGALKQFVALITDTAMPEDDSKKGEKKTSSRVGKKGGKEGKGRKDDDNKEDAPASGESIIPTLPDVKMCAARAIARSARNAVNRKLLHEQEAEKMLIHLLNIDVADVQASAALALAIISEHFTARDSIRQWGGLSPLLKLLRSDNGEVKESAALALANLTTGNSQNCLELRNMGGIETLISSLHEVREEIVASAACALTNLAQDETLRSEALAQGVVTALIEPLQSHNTNVQSKAALAVSAFTCDAESRRELRESGGLEPLVLLLHSGSDEVRRNAAWAITVCAVDEPTATEICKLGGLSILQEIQLSSSRNSPFTEAALQRLLDTNLPAKFSLYNYLGPSNLIEDGFFDCGKLKQGVPFKTLQEYCAQEMNDKRPIILVNAQSGEEPETQETSKSLSVEVKTDSLRSPGESVTKPKLKDTKVFATGAKDKGVKGKEKDLEAQKIEEERLKAQKEREERAREEELAAQQRKLEEEALKASVFTPPFDPNLVKYIDVVRETILPLPTTYAQVSALAEFVSEKMGGKIEKDQVANFCWELPLSQLKFELKSNVIPIGRIKAGIHIHRALLFKVLADRIAIPCSLARGGYNRGWNEIMLPDNSTDQDYGLEIITPNVISAIIGHKPVIPKFPPKKYIVDLVHKPGNLLVPETLAAVAYMKL